MDKLLSIALTAALKAGENILKIYWNPAADLGTEYKADRSPLTIADRKAHTTIASVLRNTNYPLLSEEGEIPPYEIRKAWKTFWMVDPLDGTKEFLKRNGEFTVNIALIRQNRPELGVIYAPVKKELYYGTITQGAYKTILSGEEIYSAGEIEARALHLPTVKGNCPYTVIVSRTHRNADTECYIGKLRQEHGQIKEITVGSSLKICLVAEGSADIYPRLAPTMEWDTAAGHAIALAAGKNIYTMDETTPLNYNKPDLHNPDFVVK